MAKDWTAAIRRAAAKRGEVDAELHAVVRQALSAGCTYAEVGEVLGISRQAAWERFHTEAPREPQKKGPRKR